MPVPTISLLPIGPSTSDSANFAAQADALIAALNPAIAQTNAAIAAFNAMAAGATNVGNATTLLGQTWADQSLSSVAGTNTITAAGPAGYTLASRQPLIIIPAVTNTGPTTLNITPAGGAALGAKNVFSNGAACIGGELVAGKPAILMYDGTQYQTIASIGATPTFAGLNLTGDLAINTNKFTVAAATGNAVVGGTLGVAGNFAVNTNKFTVAAATGNTTVAGTLDVAGVTTLSGGGAVLTVGTAPARWFFYAGAPSCYFTDATGGTGNGIVTDVGSSRLRLFVNGAAEGDITNVLFTVAHALKIGVIGAFVASDKYLVVDSTGNIHKSALGPAS